MSTFHYFSYGSNMLAERLQARCPSARVLGPGKAMGYALGFSKLSKDGSGKAMPFAQEDGSHVLSGVLFEIDGKQLVDLDRAEAAGFGYDRCEDFAISFGDGDEKLSVTTYLANPNYIDDALQPFDWYLALVIAGALQHKFPASYIDNLRAVSWCRDPNSSRITRETAIKALALAGIEDYQKLLFR